MKKKTKIFLWSILAIAVLAVSAIVFAAYCNKTILSYSKYCYSNAEGVPETETALLLGAAKIAPSGNINRYFIRRINAAAKLYQYGIIKHILISGDNSRKEYDEPTDMKNSLLERGVPESAMTLDYAGFRTLDSVVRAKNVFGKTSLLIITQPGHAERAVYIARKHGIDAIAFYAEEPTHLPQLVKRNRKREALARIAAWLDVNILSRKPKFEK